MSNIPAPDLDSEEFPIFDQKPSENLSITHINSDELVKMKMNQGRNERIDIIDCRYDFEYEGGHIKEAKLIDSINMIDDYFKVSKQEESFDNIKIVFYCEFSQNRGPEIASLFRKIDRMINYPRYPFLYYNNIYILQGGYRSFYSKYAKYCNGRYVTMDSNLSLAKYNRHIRQNLIHNYLTWNCVQNEEFQRPKVEQSSSQPIFIKAPFQLPNIKPF